MKQFVFFFVFFIVICSVSAQKIVFIGDSITDGKWGFECDGTRNTSDLNHIFGHGYMDLLASEYMALYPELNLQFYNRGISGNTISDLAQRWQTDVLDLQPDVLSILVGINDVLNNNLQPDTLIFEQTYRELLTRCRQQNTHIQIVVGEPFCEKGFRLDSTGVGRKSCEALARVAKRLAIEFEATYLPYQSLFDELCTESVTYWIWDGVHPTPAGHYKMAELWKKTVQLSFKK